MHTNPSLLVVPAVLVLGLAAFHPRVPDQLLHPSAPVVRRAPSALLGARWGHRWVYRASAQRLVYTLEQHAQLKIRQDTVERFDSVSSRVVAAFTVAGQARVTGTVNDFGVQGSGHGMSVPAGVALPFPFAATYEDRGRQLSFIAPSASPCLTPALPIAQSLRDLWFQAPDTVWLGRTWSDSTSYASCRDGIQLRTEVHRAFRVSDVVDRDGRVLLTIQRASRTTIEGDGAQSGEAVSVRGSGTGELAYTVDLVAGQILSARGSSNLQIILTGRLRTQNVQQKSDIRIDKNS
jgi:hypothetical protein